MGQRNLSKKIVKYKHVVGSLKGFGGGWGPRNLFAERIEKPVQNIGPPLLRTFITIRKK